MKYSWITAAIAGGGVLTMDGPMKGNRMVRAGVWWKEDDDVVVADLTLSVEDALEKLEAALGKANGETSVNEPTEADPWFVVDEATKPEVGLAVLGYSPEWVDEDFCPNGVRECFRNGDGSDWASAAWNNSHDCWSSDDTVPTHWKHKPQPPFA